MEHNHHSGVVKNYTGTAILSFCIIFFLFVSLSRCSGPFHPVVHHSATHETNEHNTNHEKTEVKEHH